MQFSRDKLVLAVLFSLAVHFAILAFVGDFSFKSTSKPVVVKPRETPLLMQVAPPSPPEKPRPDPARRPAAPEPVPVAAVPLAVPQDSPATINTVEKQPATKAAPPAPTAQEWAFAAKYTNRNSKAYRYNWGKQVRSMMGTAVEGPDQGMVRFHIEIGPDGKLAKLETLWSTSPVAERLARKAIESMPPLPPTPTGKPLIFDRTISFSPFASDDAPTYKDDCQPDPPRFHNPFARNANSASGDDEPQTEPLDAKAMEECLRQLPQDSIDATEAESKRMMDQWGWSSSGK